LGVQMLHVHVHGFASAHAFKEEEGVTILRTGILTLLLLTFLMSSIKGRERSTQKIEKVNELEREKEVGICVLIKFRWKDPKTIMHE